MSTESRSALKTHDRCVVRQFQGKDVGMWTYLSSDTSRDFWCSSLHSLQSSKERTNWRTLNVTRVRAWSKRINHSNVLSSPWWGYNLYASKSLYLVHNFACDHFSPPSKAYPVCSVVSGLAEVGGIQCCLPCLLLLSISKHLQYSFLLWYYCYCNIPSTTNGTNQTTAPFDL